MPRSFVTSLLVLGVAAGSGCASGKAVQQGTSAGTLADQPTSRRRALASGTQMQATILDSLSSRIDTAGETVGAVVTRDVKDARGVVVIPSASAVVLTIDRLEAGGDYYDDKPEGRLSLVVTSVSVDGQSYPVAARLDSVTHHLVSRAITKDEAERIVAGRYGYRDVIVAAGTPITFTLTEPLNVWAR